MTATSTASDGSAAVPAALRKPGFADLCRGEWMKIRTVRSTGWFLIAMAVLSVGFTVFYSSALVSSWPTLDAAEKRSFTSDAVARILQPGATFGQLAVALLGVLLVTSEYASGMIRASVLATPRRTPILAAKAAVFGTVVFVAAIAVAAGAFLVGSAITAKQASTSPADAATLCAILGFGVFMVLIGFIALAIGAIVRHPAGGVGAVAVLQYVAPLVLGFLPGPVAAHLAGALPVTSGLTMLSNGHNADDVYSPPASLGILALWTAVLLAAGFASMKHRDVP